MRKYPFWVTEVSVGIKDESGDRREITRDFVTKLSHCKKTICLSRSSSGRELYF
jgi:hypothetical protein